MSKKSTTNPYLKGTLFSEMWELSKALEDISKCFWAEFDKFYNKYIWRTRGNGPRRYKSAKALIDSLNDIAPYQQVYYRVRGTIKRIWDAPRDAYRAIKRGCQRGYRGWADEDTWCCASYYAKVIVPSIQHLKKNKMGIPMSAHEESDGVDKHGNPTDAATEKAEKRWDAILDDICYTFHVAELVMNHDWHYTETEKWDDKEFKRLKRIWKDNDIKVMSLEECIRYERGWELFQKHYFSLWD